MILFPLFIFGRFIWSWIIYLKISNYLLKLKSPSVKQLLYKIKNNIYINCILWVTIKIKRIKFPHSPTLLTFCLASTEKGHADHPIKIKILYKTHSPNCTIIYKLVEITQLILYRPAPESPTEPNSYLKAYLVLFNLLFFVSFKNYCFGPKIIQ